jgi:hypothetical protein
MVGRFRRNCSGKRLRQGTARTGSRRRADFEVLNDSHSDPARGKVHLSQIMRLTIAVFVFLILGDAVCLHAEKSNSAAKISDAVKRKLFIDPSSASVASGKASLKVSPLKRRGGNYVGEYQLKVRPYFFKSEKGSLLLVASDASVRKLQAGTAMNFTGKAVTRKDGRTHIVLGKATPSSGDRGSVMFSIITDNGTMVFNTSYHFGT